MASTFIDALIDNDENFLPESVDIDIFVPADAAVRLIAEHQMKFISPMIVRKQDPEKGKDKFYACVYMAVGDSPSNEVYGFGLCEIRVH